jgi:hypothetical protein
MVAPQQGLKGFAGAIGFLFGAVLLGALVCTGTAFAQCGPTGPTNANNTACGTGALTSNTLGISNSAFGCDALDLNTTGFNNTASGGDALFNNRTGNANTASGAFALEENTTGGDNTASGVAILISNTTGFFNTGSGANALSSNTTGAENTASGFYALGKNFAGSLNIGLGVDAGNNIVAGSNNIEIWATPFPEFLPIGDGSNTIRVGINGVQKKTFIAGISGTTVSGADVVVSSTGQLGIATSSARYKRDIHDMGGASAGLMKLRPVSFRYKDDPSETLQYGLVAEEVERVYPELVARGPDGKVQSVRYLELTALLLNELQKQTTKITAQQHEIDALKQQNASLNALSERLAALEQQVRMATPQGLRSLASK